MIYNRMNSVCTAIREGVVFDVQDGRTPLMYACLRGKERIVQLLVRHGADVLAMDRVTHTHIHAHTHTHTHTHTRTHAHAHAHTLPPSFTL